jgi:hypothetical protein
MRPRRKPVVGRRPRARRRKLEDIEQARLALWLDGRRLKGRPLLWAHVPNGGARHIAIARQLRAAGVKSGVPDVLIFDPPPLCATHVGAALELKRTDGGTASDNQRDWLKALAERGWAVSVEHGAEAAIQALERLGY